MSLSLDRVIQLVMDDLVYYPFHFVEKSDPEHSRKNCLTCCTRGRWIFYYPHGIYPRGPHRKKIVLRWNDTPFCSYMGPNQERIMDQMVSRLSVWLQVSFIKIGTYKGIGQRLMRFRVYVSVEVRQSYRPRLIKLVKIWKPLLLLLRLRIVQGRCCVNC